MPGVDDKSLNTAQGLRPGQGPWTAALRRLRLVRRSEDGVAALEFGLFAPILFVSLLTMVDLGFALNERMTIDHVLRAGAQTAMQGSDEVAIKKVLETTASKNFAAGEVIFDVVPYCACAEEPTVEVACSTTCYNPDATETSIYIRLTGAKDYDGIFLPTIALAPSVEVQLR